MHFLIMFALIGICIIVGPIVIEVGLRIALAALAVIVLVFVGAYFTEIGLLPVLVGAPFALMGAAAFLVPYLAERQRREILRAHQVSEGQHQEVDRERQERERDLAERAASAIAIWRSATAPLAAGRSSGR